MYAPDLRPRPLHYEHDGARRRRATGRAVQVDPIKPALKAPGTMRLKLIYDEPLSTFAFNYNLRRYSLRSLRRPEPVHVTGKAAPPPVTPMLVELG